MAVKIVVQDDEKADHEAKPLLDTSGASGLCEMEDVLNAPPFSDLFATAGLKEVKAVSKALRSRNLSETSRQKAAGVFCNAMLAEETVHTETDAVCKKPPSLEYHPPPYEHANDEDKYEDLPSLTHYLADVCDDDNNEEPVPMEIDDTTSATVEGQADDGFPEIGDFVAEECTPSSMIVSQAPESLGEDMSFFEEYINRPEMDVSDLFYELN